MNWQAATDDAIKLAFFLAPEVEQLQRTCAYPEPRLWLHAKTGAVYAPTETQQIPDGFGIEPWVHIKRAETPLRPAFDAMQLTPNRFNGAFGGATPLASSLAGGLLGAGLGYGAGYLGEKLLGPKVLEPGKLRWRAALLGGGLGTLPGAYLGTLGARLKARDGQEPMSAFVEPNVLFGKQGSEKQAEDSAGGLFENTIPVDAFNRAVWRDAFTPEPIQGLASGVVGAAAQSSNKPWFISPYDVGRIAVGMGGGLVSGMMAGKVFGVLAGLTPAAQQTLQQAGMWAGALQQAVPLLFGGH